MPFFFFARVARPNRWISKKFVFVHRFFGPSDFFRRRFGVQSPSFCLCFRSLQKRFNEQNLQKKSPLVICARPRRELIARPPPEERKTRQSAQVMHIKISRPKTRGFDAVFWAICFDGAASPKTGGLAAYWPKCTEKIWREFS